MAINSVRKTGSHNHLTWWEYSRYLGWLLWVVRVPAFSAALGAVVYASVPQARDLGLETHAQDFNVTDFFFATGFVLSLLYGWLLPIYFCSSALIIRSCRWHNLARAKPTTWFRRGVPVFLVLLGLAGLLRGQFLAWADADRIHDNAIELWQVPNIILLIEGTMVIAVAFLTGNVLQRLTRPAGYRHLMIGAGLVVAAAALWTLSIHPYAVEKKYYAEIGDPMSTGLSSWPVRLWQWYFPVVIALIWIGVQALRRYIRGRRHQVYYQRWLAFSIPSIAVLGFFVASPFFVAEGLKIHRAILAPLVFGAWVPLFAYLGYWSHRVRAPLVFLFLLSCGLLGHFHEGHVVRPMAAEHRPQQLSLEEALTSWQASNHCDGDGGTCRPLVLVAAEGGASRAGFFTGTVLGEIVDRFAQPEAPTATSPGRTGVSPIFAISGVSGGGLGAAFFAAALSDGTQAENRFKPPCGATGSTFPPDLSLWHRGLEKTAAEDYSQSWRNCLQVLLSRDFLSPVIIRLAFGDLLGLTGIFRTEDRARALERAWERSYQSFTGRDTFEKPFSNLLPRAKAPWRPILLLSGSSVETGRRVIASHLSPWFCHDKESQRVFADAYDVHELLSDNRAPRCSCQNATAQCTPPSTRELSLSEAVAVTARFPLISPPGGVEWGGRILDRIVDGGYIDNSGITTVRDLAVAISKIRPKLKVSILFITNDPNTDDMECVPPNTHWGPRIEPVEPQWLALPAIANAVLAARTGRSRQVATSFCDEARTKGYAFKRIGVFPPVTKAGSENNLSYDQGNDRKGGPEEKKAFQGISMSWWLSKFVQRHLDNQLKERSCSPPAAGAGSEKFANNSQLCELLSASTPR